jgi:hypothetical protein
VKLAGTTGWQGRFDPEICASYPKRKRVYGKITKKSPLYMLSFTTKELLAAKRRKKNILRTKNLGADTEASMCSAKHPFPAGKLPM